MLFELVITHTCNKNCRLCDQRISTSSFGHMTFEHYEGLIAAMHGYAVREVRLTGGEPLTHPRFADIVSRLRRDFPDARLVMATNGELLDTMTPAMRNSFSRITVSYYGAFNRDVIARILRAPREYPNVYIVDSRTMTDPDVPGPLSERTARRSYRMCVQRDIRVVGDRIYGCCQAEAIERTYPVPNVHCTLRPGWEAEYRKLATVNACRYCFSAHLMSGSWLAAARSFGKSWILHNQIGNAARRVKRAVMRRKLREIIA